MGLDDEDYAIFSYTDGNSQAQGTFLPSQIFTIGSAMSLYDKEYDGSVGNDPVASCNVDPAKYHKVKIVQYKASNNFPSDEDRSYCAWFKLKNNTSSKTRVDNFNFDLYTRELTLNFSKSSLYFVDDMITLTRVSGTAFSLFGKVTEIISSTSVKIKIDNEIYDYVQSNFSSWISYTDIQAQRSFSRVFLNSQIDGKGILIELYENRHFKVTMNNSYSYFSIPGNVAELENSKWLALFVNFSNTFKQLTLNVWKMQWDAVAKIPATTDLKLIYNKTLPLAKEDRSSASKYFLEPSYMDLTNIRLFNRTVETDNQVLVLNQNIVKDAQWALIIDNALHQSKVPYIGYTR